MGEWSSTSLQNWTHQFKSDCDLKILPLGVVVAQHVLAVLEKVRVFQRQPNNQSYIQWENIISASM